MENLVNLINTVSFKTISKRGKMAKIKRIGVLKFALFIALWAAFIGFLEGIVVSIITLIIPSSISVGGAQVPISIPFISPLSFITFPLIFAIVIFPLSLIMGLIINLILKIVKGFNLTIDFSDEHAQTQQVQKTA